MSDEVKFPCEAVPAEPVQARLIGLYEQRQAGLWMQRVRIPGGRISPQELLTLAELARRWTPGYPLHVTTRQDVEFHGLKAEVVPQLQRSLSDTGLTTVGTCGDTLRNVTVCPGSGVCMAAGDMGDLGESIRGTLERLSGIRTLPRKFKVSVSGCAESCARPWVNDVGVVRREDGRFRVIVGGSLGPRPGTGLEFADGVTPQEVVELTVAAVKLFEQEGDRQNRGKARLRHVRERLGQEEFRRRLKEAWDRERGKWTVLKTGGIPGAKKRHWLRLNLSLGDLSVEEARDLARSVERARGEIRLGLDHDVLVFTDEELELEGQAVKLTGSGRVTVCPGSTWCKRAIVETRAVALQLRQTLAGKSQCVTISGCPNDCARAQVAAVGLVGRVKSEEGTRREGFRLFIGGGEGKTAALAREASAWVKSEDVGKGDILLFSGRGSHSQQ